MPKDWKRVLTDIVDRVGDGPFYIPPTTNGCKPRVTKEFRFRISQLTKEANRVTPPHARATLTWQEDRGILTTFNSVMTVRQRQDFDELVLIRNFDNIGEPSLEWPLDANSIKRALDKTAFSLVTAIDGSRLLVTGVAAYVALDGPLAGDLFSMIQANVWCAAKDVYDELLDIQKERAKAA